MDFKFINCNPEFKVYQEAEFPGAYLYYTGVFDQSTSSVFRTLNDNKFPSNLKGNFAFVFCNQYRIVGAVDHLPTTNLFYGRHENKLYVSHIYNILDQYFPSSFNWTVDTQIRFFWGGSVGENTLNYYIKRLEAGHYFEHNITTGQFDVKPYIDLYTHHIDSSITKQDISDAIEQAIENPSNKIECLGHGVGYTVREIVNLFKQINDTDFDEIGRAHV